MPPVVFEARLLPPAEAFTPVRMPWREPIILARCFDGDEMVGVVLECGVVSCKVCRRADREEVCKVVS